jgi:hypothetical protein
MAWRNVWRAGDEEVDMNFAHVPFEDFDLQLRTNVSYELPQANGYVRPKQLFTVLRDPHKVLLQVKSGVRCPSVVLHLTNVLKWSPKGEGF